MKTISLIIILSLLISNACCQTLQELKEEPDWDLEQLEFDIHNLKEPISGMMTMGAFPVKEYIGAAGIVDHSFIVGNERIVGATFFVGKHEGNQHFYQGQDTHRAFFTILCVAEGDLAEGEANIDYHILSRNHPNYIGQGYIKNTSFPIEFLSFTNSREDGHALINLKLFDIRDGNTILVAPQKDKSLRFYQITSPYLNMEMAAGYYKSLIEKDEVLEFFQIRKYPVEVVEHSLPDKTFLDKRIEVKFTNELTKDDLLRIQQEMKDEKIELSYENVDYDEKGRLSKIFFKVKTEDGYGGSATSDDLTSKPIGFFVDYRKEAKSGFGTGYFWK